MRRPAQPSASSLAGRYSVEDETGTVYLTLEPDGTYREMVIWPDGKALNSAGKWSMDGRNAFAWRLELTNANLRMPWREKRRPTHPKKGDYHMEVVLDGGDAQFILSDDLCIRLKRMRTKEKVPREATL